MMMVFATSAEMRGYRDDEGDEGEEGEDTAFSSYSTLLVCRLLSCSESFFYNDL